MSDAVITLLSTRMIAPGLCGDSGFCICNMSILKVEITVAVLKISLRLI